MKFEYDENKSSINKQKHGIDFEEVQQLWKDDNMLELMTSFENEMRYLTIGQIHHKFYTVVITYRNDNIRIISARRSRKKEIEIYDSRRV
jgi:uncharacterized DUF497 family protein